MWVARDKDNTLAFYNDEIKPYRVNDKEWEGHNFCYLDSVLFPNIKWEDEPIEVEIISKKI